MSFWLDHSRIALTQKLSKTLQNAVKNVPREDALAANHALAYMQKQADKVTFYTARPQTGGKKSHLNTLVIFPRMLILITFK